MLLNATTAISTSKVLLVPYSKWHVPRYHEWMQDEEIQEATASEPLTLEEEYAMQQSWRQDPDKLTFIICLSTPSSSSNTPQPLAQDDDSPDRMVGDINLFLRVDDDNEDDLQIIGEVELMIAEKKDQRRGFGKAALLSFLHYVVTHESELVGEFLERDETAGRAMAAAGRARGSGDGDGDGDRAGTQTKNLNKLAALSVKIGQTNERSLALFEGVGMFRRVGESPNYFGEWELRRKRTDLTPVSVQDALAKAGVVAYGELPYERSR